MKEVSYSDYYSEFIVNGDSIYCYKVGLKDVDYILTYTYPMDFLRKEALHESGTESFVFVHTHFLCLVRL